MANPYTLLTIGPSHFCEKARWALDYLDVPYREEAHPPILHWWWSLRSGGGRTLPILKTGHLVIGDSTEILRFLDAEHGDGRRLVPIESGLRDEVDELEELFDTRLGPHTRRVAYFHLLPHRTLVRSVIEPGVGRSERLIFAAGLPLFGWLMRRGMRIDAASAQRSLDRVRRIFREVDERMADGRRFLVGHDFTAADVSFAALAAPLVLPFEYGAPLPPTAELPAAFVEIVDELRATAAGDFALRLYRESR
jgi:glutathione S-transferase